MHELRNQLPELAAEDLHSLQSIGTRRMRSLSTLCNIMLVQTKKWAMITPIALPTALAACWHGDFPS
jgi:hypothetical protein